jgi:CO dehydrogenase/acetyl-CoA synthase gamma subunit (corrinoid Fe-S protein)
MKTPRFLHCVAIIIIANAHVCFTKANAMELPQNILNYLQSESLMEDNILPFLETSGKVFVEYVVTNRVQVLNNFSTVAANPNQQKLLLAAMEFATPADYLATLDKVCDLKQSNVIGNDVFEFAFSATPIGKGFLSYNYQNAQVQAVIQRAQALLPNNAAFQAFLTAILDGSQKVTDQRYFELNELPEPQLLSQ